MQNRVVSSYVWSSADPRLRRRAWILVAFIQIFLLLILFYFGFVTPLPLPGEEGIAVSFGQENAGRNEEFVPQAVSPAVVHESVREEVVEEEPLTQDFEEAPAVTPPKREKPKKEEIKTEEHVKPREETQQFRETQHESVPQPTVNQQALFPGVTETSQKETGNGGDLGIQGRKDGEGVQAGVGEGVGRGSGSGSGAGAGGNGIGYSVGNRKALKLPSPEYPGQKNGKVVVKVWVNKEGRVLKAQAGEKGSTIYDKSFLTVSEAAALQAHFDVSADAPEMQVGTITYVFRLKQ